MSSITFLTALAAGILSFLSPCILPLVPVYLANIAGASVLTPDLADRRHIFLHTISFIVGFSLVFTALGASLGLLGAAVPQGVLEKVAGALLITFGIFLSLQVFVPRRLRAFASLAVLALGVFTWAESPASKTRPLRKVSATR